jgi:hypothetical protein
MPVNASKVKGLYSPLLTEEQKTVLYDIHQQLKSIHITGVQRVLPDHGEEYLSVRETVPTGDPININRYISEEQAAIATIQKSDPTDIQAISASKLTLSNSFYNNALRQSQQSFLWALIWAGVGALFIISTVTLVIILQPTIATSVIIANSACEGLEGTDKQQMRSEIIRKLVE